MDLFFVVVCFVSVIQSTQLRTANSMYNILTTTSIIKFFLTFPFTCKASSNGSRRPRMSITCSLLTMTSGGALAVSLASMRAWAKTVMTALQADSCTMRRNDTIMEFQRQLLEEGHRDTFHSFIKT